MKQIIIGYAVMLVIIIVLNVRAWNMTRAETFVDPINWIGAAIVVLIGGFMLWKERN